MGLFKRKKKEEVRASVGDADARAALSFGEMDVEELQAYLTRERAAFDAAVQEKKAEFREINERIDRLVARRRFGELVDSLPDHARDELANLLIEED